MQNLKVGRIEQVEDATGLKRSQLYKLTKENRFPKPIKLMGRASGWIMSEVEAWIAERAAERDAKFKSLVRADSGRTIDVSNLNRVAADWLSTLFLLEPLRDKFREEFLRCLPEGDWTAYNDYDPSPGPLIDAIRACEIECSGTWFSGARVFPDKTGIRRSGTRLFVKEGRSDGWRDLETGSHDFVP
ncbi:MAG: AlpA family transcriptional regulator [Propionivibrio sp.]|uniref:helix-turn-helix transcriptional regulator n=1 Tax=Propionivibrio sp. TaxID=2212460 RepID=UPI0025FE9661|nr:AlpA family transcriptional regulator [Propionivibrio sp.]MBK8892534.1 AlpA family transcriptional regulator [Propionivibrio sp.]